MEARVKTWRAMALAACLALAGCEPDPARAVKIEKKTPPPPAPSAPATPAKDAEPVRPTDDIVHRPPASTAASAPSTASKSAAPWRPVGCPPPLETARGQSTFSVTGPCEFEHHGEVACEAAGDDFLVTMSRPGARGSTVMVFINVEKYKGPGDYDGAQMFLGVQDKKNIYRWSSEELKITVGEGERFTTLPRTPLPAEPVLVECTGPMTNYQCAGRGEDAAMEATVAVVSGTLQCGKGTP